MDPMHLITEQEPEQRLAAGCLHGLGDRTAYKASILHSCSSSGSRTTGAGGARVPLAVSGQQVRKAFGLSSHAQGFLPGLRPTPTDSTARSWLSSPGGPRDR